MEMSYALNLITAFIFWTEDIISGFFWLFTPWSIKVHLSIHSENALGRMFMHAN